MWPVILFVSAFWIADYRHKRYPWDQTLATLAFALLILVPLAALTPGWLWKTALMGYMTFPWWYTPVRLLRRPIAVAEPRTRPVDPEHDGIGPPLAEMLERAARLLEAEGMVRIGLFREDVPGEITLLTAHLESPDGAELVTVNGGTTLILPGTEAEERRSWFDMAVTTEFADGRKLSVANVDLPRGAPGSTREILPGVDHPARLLRIARAYRARWFADARSVPLRGNTPPLEYWAERHRRAMQMMEARGLYRRRPDGAWGLTPRGAVVMPWSLLFPFRQIRALRLHLRERRVLRELGMPAEGDAPFPRPRRRHSSDLQGAAALVLAVLYVLLG